MKQAIISKALEIIGSAYRNSSGELILLGFNAGSCPALNKAICMNRYMGLEHFELLSDSIMQEYREFSGALEKSSGFKGVALSKDIVQWQTYRQEMLYYFWMANQEM